MLLLLLKTSIATLILAIGMTAVTDDIAYIWRRPVLLMKSIIAMYLVSIPYVLWIRKRRKRA